MLGLDETPRRLLDRIVLIPKNRGLNRQVATTEADLVVEPCARVTVRGEDVPFLANEIARSGREVLAITGDDLLDEWLLGGNVLDERLRRRKVAWRDPSALFGAPALCLIGRSPEDLAGSRTIRMACCSRYRRQTERYVDGLRNAGVRLEVLPVAGAVETCITSGVSDVVVDIVLTGKTMLDAGLRVLRVISTSDLAVLETPA